MILAILDRWQRFKLRLRAIRANFLSTNSRAYRRRASEEVEHYAECHASSDDGRYMEAAPPVWEELQHRVGGLIHAATGHDLAGYITGRLRARPGARMLSLGSGPGGVEFVIARETPEASIRCLDLNPEVLAVGRNGAAAENLRVEFAEADLNLVELPEHEFDIVLCHASLHHILELEHLADQIRRTLRPGGELVVTDIITRNGYRMWPETRRWVDRIWKTLPEAYRVNHTSYPDRRVDHRIWERDTRSAGMECLRSQDILKVLRDRFDTVHYVPHFALCRRFFDTMYGPNYDLGRPLDRAIVDWIWELDRHAIQSGILRPETFFGVFR